MGLRSTWPLNSLTAKATERQWIGIPWVPYVMRCSRDFPHTTHRTGLAAANRAVSLRAARTGICSLIASEKLPCNTHRISVLWRLVLARNVSQAKAKSVLQGLLTRQPESRLGGGPEDGAEVRAHSFFSTVDWQALYQRLVTPPFKPKVAGAGDVSNFEKEFVAWRAKLVTCFCL